MNITISVVDFLYFKVVVSNLLMIIYKIWPKYG